jgi:PAS domain S-box-containing protein
MVGTGTYREIVEDIDDGVVLLDRDGRYLYTNPAGERLLGATLESIAGRLFWDVAEPTLGAAVRQSQDRILTSAEVQVLRNYFARGRWYEVVGRRTRDAVLLLFRDVTERLQEAAARHGLEQRFQLLVDGVKEYAIVLMDVQGRIVTWNKGAERISRYAAEEIIGKHFSVFYPPESQTQPVRALEAAVAQGRYEEEGVRVRKDGSRYWASVVITPLFNELGEPSGFAKVVRDISERRRNQEALRRSEERLRLAAEAGRIGMIDFCPATGEVIWDRRCREMWGLPPDARVTYESWLRRVHPGDRRRADAAIEKALVEKLGGELNDEYRTLERNGAEHWIAVRGKVSFDDAGRPQRFFGTMRDVTEQHHLDQLRDRLSGIFAHDLRAPLSAIRVASTLLVGGSEAEVRHAADIIARGADRMTRMIEQLMDFTRVRLGGGMPFHRERVDLASVCREIATEAELGHPGTRVWCDVRGDCIGSWDKSQIGRIVSNLVSNAVQHGGKDAPVEISVRGERQSVSLAVHNKGKIPETLLPLIFDPFRRGERREHAHEPATGSGLGLGLFITRELVSAHGGDIDVTSSEDAGTTFLVRLPRASQDVGTQPRA